MASDISIIIRAINQTRDDFAQVVQDLKRVEGESDRATSGVDRLRGGFDRLTPVLHVAAAAIAAIGLGRLVSDIVDTSTRMDQLRRGFETVLGSSEAARRELDWLADAADRLGVNFMKSADGFLQITASAQGTILAGEGVRDLYEQIALRAMSLGRSQADLDGMLLAVRQSLDKGVLSAEDFKQQFAERMPGALDIAARAMRMTKDEFIEVMSKGAIESTRFWRAYTEELSHVNDGAEETLSKAVLAKERMGNAWDALMDKLGQNGALDAAVSIFGTLTEELETLGEWVVEHQDDIEGFFRGVSTVVDGLATSLGVVLGVWQELNRVMAGMADQVPGTSIEEHAAREQLQEMQRQIAEERQMVATLRLEGDEYQDNPRRQLLARLEREAAALQAHIKNTYGVRDVRRQYFYNAETGQYETRSGLNVPGRSGQSAALAAAEDDINTGGTTSTGGGGTSRAEQREMERRQRIVDSALEEIRKSEEQAAERRAKIIEDLTARVNRETMTRAEYALWELDQERLRLEQSEDFHRMAEAQKTSVMQMYAELRAGLVHDLAEEEQDALQGTEDKAKDSARRMVNAFQSFAQQGMSWVEAFRDGSIDSFTDVLNVAFQAADALTRIMGYEGGVMDIAAQLVGSVAGSLGGSIGGGSGSLGGLANATAFVFHQGGIVGETAAPARVVDPAWFRSAPRMHSGGPVLGPNEVPIIAERGEHILQKGARLSGDQIAVTMNVDLRGASAEAIPYFEQRLKDLKQEIPGLAAEGIGRSLALQNKAGVRG